MSSFKRDELFTRLAHGYDVQNPEAKRKAIERARAVRREKEEEAKAVAEAMGKPSAKNAKPNYRTSFMDTAMHVFKGAVVRVLGLSTGGSTAAYSFEKDQQFRVTVELGSATFEESKHARAIEDAANAKVVEDAPCFFFKMARDEAEAQYGDYVFDSRKPPAAVTELSLIYLDGWNISCTPVRPIKSTGSLQALKITKCKVRASKNQVDFFVKVEGEDRGSMGAPATCPPPPRDSVLGISGAEAQASDYAAAAPAATATEDAATAAAEKDESGQVVTPWEVEAGEGGVDYDRLINEFGSSAITADLVARVEHVTRRPAHHWLRRGLFFSHRELDMILSTFEAGKPFYLYTGRGPSSEALHLGHMIPFMFTRYLQEAFDVPLVVQLTDDEKFLWKDLTLEEAHRLAFENARDIIACGFDPDKTFIFSDLDYVGHMYPNICRIQKAITYNRAAGVFGFGGSHSIGQVAFPAVQAAPSFPSSFPVVLGGSESMRCLIPCAIDQDPYFRVTRDIAPRLGFYKPALIHSKFFPALQGSRTKMSASNANTAIYVTDSAEQIKTKIMKFAFSGGGETMEEHRANGANLDVDVAFQWLNFFLEDDARLEHIRQEYGSGRMLTGEVKQELVDVLVRIVGDHQRRRALVTDDVVRQFMAVRRLKF